MAPQVQPDATLTSVLHEAVDRIRAAGSESPQLDAELLVGKALDLDRVQLRTHDQNKLTVAEQSRVEALVERREQREPVAYILGTAVFRNIELRVDQRVLIPRPETELLVEWAIEHTARTDRSPVRILDVCTGSGAIPLALHDELLKGSAILVATDLSQDALDVARENAEMLGAQVDWNHGNLLDPVADQRFDIVTANPPYVLPEDRDSLAPDVIDYEPEMALFVVEGDAFSPTREIIEQSLTLLESGGLCAVEVGAGFAEPVADLFRSSGFINVEIRCDLQGIGRTVGGYKL